MFRLHGGDVYLAELEAGFDECIRRNRTENRMLHKPSKRDTEASYRLNSNDREIDPEHYIRINNTDLPPEETADRIMEAFSLESE